jgi:hypothetical protein
VKPIRPFVMTWAPGGAQMFPRAGWRSFVPQRQVELGLAQARRGRVQPTLGLGVDAAIPNLGVGVAVSRPTWGWAW